MKASSFSGLPVPSKTKLSYSNWYIPAVRELAARDDFDEQKLAFDITVIGPAARFGEVGDRMDRHKPVELRFDLLQNHRRAAGDDRDPRPRRRRVDF